VRPILVALLALASLIPRFAAAEAQQPLSGLGADDLLRLSRGEAVIRQVRDARSLALSAKGELADRLISRISALKPNYLSELIFLAPEREGAIESLALALADVKGYIGIPYWSKRQKTYYDLFDKMEITSRTTLEGGERIEAVEHMEPFAEFGCRYAYRASASPSGGGSELFFECENTSPISYSGISAVSPSHMTWLLYAFPSEGKIVFYGVGAVKAFDMFGVIRDRLETSFLGRVEAFFGYMSKKLGGAEPGK
jgi:hypothetical protein